MSEVKSKMVDVRQFKDGDFVKSSSSRWFTCVSVARGTECVAVRDTKDPHKATLGFTKAEWRAFVKGVKAGEFDI